MTYEQAINAVVNGFEYPLWEIIGHYKLKGIEFSLEDTIIDIGTNVGHFSIVAARKGAGRIIGYEISEQSYNQALINCKDYSQIEIHNLGVWSSNGVIKYNSWEEGHQTLSVLKGGNKEIKCISLDSILEPLDKVRFLKVDCEGSEYEILMNSKLLSRVEQIAIEVHIIEGTPDPKELKEYLEKSGFKVKHCLTGNPGLSFMYVKNKGK